MQAYYAARAAEYDRIYDKPERQADLAALRRSIPPMFAGRRTLEIACGTGYWTQFIAPFASETVAVDSAPETLEIARARRVSGNVRFALGDAYDLSRELGSFDAAFAGFWFSHVPRRRRKEFLNGLHPLLTRGATVVLLDNVYVVGSSTPIAEVDEEGNTYQMRSLQDGSRHRVLKNFPAAAELESLIEGIGTHPRFARLDHYWTFRYAVA